MKNDEREQNHPVISFKSQTILNNHQQTGLVCPFGKQSKLLCMNKKCNTNALICSQNSCECRKTHKKCTKTDLQSFIQNISENPVKSQIFNQIIDSKIQSQIDFLSDFLDKMILKSKETLKLFGMTKAERQLLSQIKNKKSQKIIGSKIWTILLNLQNKQHTEQIFSQTLLKIENHFQKASNFLKGLSQTVELQLINCNKKAQSYLGISHQPFKKNLIATKQFGFSSFQSKIVKTQKQFDTLESFFLPKKKVLASRLLYRATQNNFSVKRFHQKCDGIPHTLILVETDKNKKIGGYTPIQWQSLDDGQFHEDSSQQSFIFSITEGDKFVLTDGKKAVYHQSQIGPRFGRLSNLRICEKANIQLHSFGRIDSHYMNQKYEQHDDQSRERFIGHHKSYHFYTLQWEVWSLEFDNNGHEQNNSIL